jgi:hypothetical protein
MCPERKPALPPFISPESLLDRLFRFTDGRQAEHRRFLSEMISGILGARSPLISNVARFLDEPIALIQTEKRLCRELASRTVPWDELKERALELASFEVRMEDVIAFDPGDLIKHYAEKMENLYRVHDGSRDECGNGYEEFAVEAIRYEQGRRHHIPLYQKLTNAKCRDYISQNFQIVSAIQAVYEYLGENRGIWTFDRAHDRKLVFEKALLRLKLRWIVRSNENRMIIPEDSRYLLPRQYHTGVWNLVKQLPLSDQPIQLRFPQRSAPLYVAWHRVRLVMDPDPNRWLSVVVVHDRRNNDPVVLLTNLEVRNIEQAVIVFGYYLERWRKEEGYRFCKSFLNLENIRVMSFEAIANLAWLEHLTYAFVTLTYRSAPDRLDELCQQRLRHFVDLRKVRYRYYRVAEMMRVLLWEQRGKSEAPLLMTEVG